MSVCEARFQISQKLTAGMIRSNKIGVSFLSVDGGVICFN